MDNQQLFEEANNAEVDDYAADCRYICGIAEKYFGIKMTLKQSRSVWEEYSDGMAAGWMAFTDDKHTAWQISYYISKRTGQHPEQIYRDEE
jgi:hypothetical protein